MRGPEDLVSTNAAAIMTVARINVEIKSSIIHQRRKTVLPMGVENTVHGGDYLMLF